MPALPTRPDDEPPRLAEIQRGLWLAHRLDPGSPAYNLSSAFHVQGSLNEEKLQEAFNTVVQRHRILRSTFSVDGGGADDEDVLQVVHPFQRQPLEILDANNGDGVAVATEAAKKPFDLERGPLARLVVVREPPEKVLLVLVLHHILADERSLAWLWNELTEIYNGGSPPAPDVQYDDFVHWARSQESQKFDQELSYWRNRLEPLPEDLRLPIEKPVGKQDEDGGAPGRFLSRGLSAEVRQGVRDLAAATGVTPFMVFAFAYRLLLQRYTDGQRVAFATPASTRSHPATAQMLGYFTNPVVVVEQIDEEKSVESSLSDFSLPLREALTRTAVPFQTLAESLSPPRQQDRHPIFQTMFVYQESETPPRLAEARLEPLTLDLGASKFDLTLFVSQQDSDTLEIAVEYRSDRFDNVGMERLIGHYEQLLTGLATDTRRSTAEVHMVAADEAAFLNKVSQGLELQTDFELLPTRIAAQADSKPDAPAVACGGVTWSYLELQQAAQIIAQRLVKVGVHRNNRVGIFLNRSREMIAAILGCHLAGAAYVPLDPDYPTARNENVLADADVSAVLTTTDLRDRSPAGSWTVLLIDQPAPAGAFEVAECRPESVAYLLYTSGSTGDPKGVVVSHDNLRASTAARFQAYDAAPKRFLLVPSIAFDSSVAGLFWTLAAGGALVIPTAAEAKDPGRLNRLVAREKVDSLLLVPSLYAQMIASGGDALQTLAMAIVAGESCPRQLVADHYATLPQTRLFNEYGPTEGTVWATWHEMKPNEDQVLIGRPIPGVRMDVLDQRSRPVPVGIPGHGWIAGPTVAQGYWRRDDATAERFRDDRYQTGDRMAWMEDGSLLFLGRDDEQIKLRGFRIEPGEIEGALTRLPGIDEAAVVARPAGPNARLVAFVRLAENGAVEDWRHEMSRRLPGHMIPSRLVVLSEIHRLPNGKVDRRRLRNRPLAPEVVTREVGETRVPSTTEQALLSLWEGLLGRPVRLNDNFFELGGHSLLVVEMTRAVERDFEVSLSAPDIFENPTVEELAQRIDEGATTTAPYRHLFPLQPSGRGIPMIFAVPHFFSAMFAERFRGERPVYGLRGVSLRAEGNSGQWRTMQDLGAELVDEIERRFSGQHCLVAGYSFGASMAFEAVRIMEERGIQVEKLYLITPMPLDIYRWGPLRFQIDGLRKPLSELSNAEALRLVAQSNRLTTRRPYQRAWRWLAIEPWRRFLCFIGRLRKLAGLPLTPRILHADVRVERFRLHAGYQPKTLKTPTVIFNGREPETDAAATWKPHFAGPLTIVETPDPHLGDEAADAARKIILEHLEELR